jgi:hypothetical protein
LTATTRLVDVDITGDEGGVIITIILGAADMVEVAL